jgi:TRAP-type transport system periplasmic protein
MSPAQQKVIDDHCTTEWAAAFADPWADFEHAGLEKIKGRAGSRGLHDHDEQLAEWKKSAEPLQAEMGRRREEDRAAIPTRSGRSCRRR